MFLSILWMLLIGLLAGAIAKMIFPGKQNMGWIVTSLLGVAGSFFAGFLLRLLSKGDGGPAGFIASVIGAVILLWIYERFAKK